MAKKEDDREEAVIVNKTTQLGKEQYLIQSMNTKNRLTVEAETEVQRTIENKRGKVNKVYAKYEYGQKNNKDRGHVYNIEYDRNPQHMVDNQLRQDTRINDNMNRELKKKL